MSFRTLPVASLPVGSLKCNEQISVILLSQETMEYLCPSQSFVELQFLLWQNSPIREWQSLLQLLQVKPVIASVGTDSALCRLRCLFSSHWSLLFPSLSFMLVLTASRQLTWSVVAASKSVGFRLPAFRSCWQTSLYRSAGLPVGLMPEASSPYMMSLGIRPSCIRETWPSQRRRLCERNACILSAY